MWRWQTLQDQDKNNKALVEQRDQGDNILETIRLQTPDQILHATGFKLKYCGSLISLQQFESSSIV